MNVCKRVLYEGRVQGVGFRYTARQIARSHPVTGYVRNLPDGRVELVVAGSSDHVQVFLNAVAERMAENIRSQHVTDAVADNWTGFEIRH